MQPCSYSRATASLCWVGRYVNDEWDGDTDRTFRQGFALMFGMGLGIGASVLILVIVITALTRWGLL